MALFSKRCLEELREKVDLSEVISSYINLKKAGASYKGLCPFHNEKSPSFIVQKGDTHYHCFGCGAHGDAMGFLMNFLKLSFVEAVEMLAGKFGVALEYQEGEEKREGSDLTPLKQALNVTKEFFHFHLLYTDEGHQALDYLYKRGLDLSFIEMFQIGFAPRNEALMKAFFQDRGLTKDVLIKAGLAKESKEGKVYPFFSSRIMFPIEDISGNTIGFSGRSIDKSQHGGKYINTPETPLFKKSRLLYGLNYSRKRIAKEQKAIIVEGQIDALRLIKEGLNLTVAGQGTAFGADHVLGLKKLGVTHVYIAFDGDEAGRAASVKVGQLFQKIGIEVSVAKFKDKEDPDTVLSEQGLEALTEILKASSPYIEFLVNELSKEAKSDTPAGKNRLAKKIIEMIRDWDHPLMVHEALKELSLLLKVPEEFINPDFKKPVPVKVEAPQRPPGTNLNGNRVLECDLIRWLFVMRPEDRDGILKLIDDNIQDKIFRDEACKKLFCHMYSFVKEGKTFDIFDLSESIDKEDQILIDQIVKKRVNIEKCIEGVTLAIEKILEREWMIQREEIKSSIQKGQGSEDEILELAKKFDEIKKKKPKVQV